MWRCLCTRAFAFALLTAGIVGLLLQYTIQDRIAGLAAVFYGLPPLVLVGATLISAGLLARRAALRWVVVSIVAALLAIATWIRTDYTYSCPPARVGDLRVVLWNMGAPRALEPFVAVLKETGGQVILLLESRRGNERPPGFWQSRFPNHSVTLLGGGATLLSEYPVSRVSTHRTGKRTYIHTCGLSTPAGDLSLVMVDIESNLLSNRGPLVARAHEVAMSSASATIVLGDFNTPHTSAFFRKFRQSFRHAFESSGRGLIPTWPALCPLLALDHIWLSPGITPVRTRTLRTFHSDHALVIADVMVDADGRAEEAKEP